MECDQHHPFRFLIVHDNDIALTSRDVTPIDRNKAPGDSISKAFGGFPIDGLHQFWRDASQRKPLPEMIRIANAQRVGGGEPNWPASGRRGGGELAGKRISNSRMSRKR